MMSSVGYVYVVLFSLCHGGLCIGGCLCRHQGNGCVMARSSQPLVGVFNWRSGEDEKLLLAISRSCTSSGGTCHTSREEQLVASSDFNEYGSINFVPVSVVLFTMDGCKASLFCCITHCLQFTGLVFYLLLSSY